MNISKYVLLLTLMRRKIKKQLYTDGYYKVKVSRLKRLVMLTILHAPTEVKSVYLPTKSV